MRLAYWLVLGTTLFGAGSASAQFTVPAAPPVDGATQFKRQCATCHTLNASEPQRQGPTLAHVYGRKAGTIAGFAYSDGLKNAGWVWDADNLDVWISNPQAMVPGSYMIYHQPNPAIRKQVIDYLRGLP